MKNREIPKGLRDLLPEEVAVHRDMQQKAARLFTSYGYREVVTPTFEFLEVVESGTGEISARIYFSLWTGRVVFSACARR